MKVAFFYPALVGQLIRCSITVVLLGTELLHIYVEEKNNMSITMARLQHISFLSLSLSLSLSVRVRACVFHWLCMCRSI